MFSATTGLGRELVSRVSNVQVERIAGQVVLIGLLAVNPSFGLRWAEKRVTRRYANTGQETLVYEIAKVRGRAE